MRQKLSISFSLKMILHFLFGIAMMQFTACTHDKMEQLLIEPNYPPEIGNIILTKCAVSGCHTSKSKSNSDGLSLETWNQLFEGATRGSVVIPYSTDFSTLLYYLNSDSTQGISLHPTMPYNQAPLTNEEYLTFVTWIQNGAPDKNGFVKFSDDPMRRKFYVGNQGCDVVTVFDISSMLAMRYVGVGGSHAIESPHMIKVAPNNQFWCVSFLGSSYFQKYSTVDNQLLGQVNITSASWKSFTISSDSKKAYAVDWSYGNIAVIDLETMTAQVTPELISPNGCALNKTNDTLYATCEVGNFIYKIPVNDVSNVSTKSMNGLPIAYDSSLAIHDILFSNDGSKYFITCQTTNEVREVNTANDSVIVIFHVGALPQELSISNQYPYLFVSCTEDTTTFTGKRGSVFIINTQTNSLNSIYAGPESQGLVVDDYAKRVYVVNRNISVDGIAPHHSSVCGGKNGYVSAIDLPTLQMISGFNTEVSVDPYCVGITHQ